MTKMIPPVPTSAVLMPTPKQKIGFSIESIVGNDASAPSPTAVGDTNSHNNHSNHNNHSSSNLDSSHHNTNSNNSTASGPTSPPQTPPASIAALMGATHLPGAPHLPLQLPHPHAVHLPPHLSPAQQHALQQHLLLQHQHQQQQQQQQQHHQQQSMLAKSLDVGMPMRHDIQDIIQRLHNSAAAAAHLSINAGPYSPPQTRLTPEESAAVLHLKRERSPVPAAMEHAQNPAQRPHHLQQPVQQQQQHQQQQQQQQHSQPQPPHTPPKSVSPQSSHPPSPPAQPLPGSPTTPQQQQQQQQPQFVKHTPGGPGSAPILVPGMPPAGLLRPFPIGGPGGVPPPPPPPPPQQGMPDIKALPPYINAPPELPPQHNPHLIAAAQFQMAAALQAGHVLGPAAAAAAAAGLPPHAAQFMPNPGMPRDSYPLYPWLLSRHGRIFPHRFPGNFLLQPFRKPKRIRTAFSPSQLLKLEHAFESNQYVVGAERKALAQSLNLSETQVKVWFQNRRTKHKRMQQEDEKGGSGGGGGGGASDRNSHGASCDEDDDDELIDMEMDDCGSDEEHELDASH